MQRAKARCETCGEISMWPSGKEDPYAGAYCRGCGGKLRKTHTYGANPTFNRKPVDLKRAIEIRQDMADVINVGHR